MNIARLLQVIYTNKVAHPEHFPDELASDTEYLEVLLDEIEPDLRKSAEDFGLPYIRPDLTSAGKVQLTHCPDDFAEAYMDELLTNWHSGMTLVVL